MSEIQRYIYHTQNVCPPEIHFSVDGAVIESIRFVGGGCPGNARLVERLLEGNPIDDVLPMLDGIECSKGTSCPDQLAKALKAIRRGELRPAASFRVEEDLSAKHAVALIGELNGDNHVLRQLAASTAVNDVEALYCTGNLVDPEKDGKKIIKTIGECGLRAVAGETDWAYAIEGDALHQSSPSRKTVDFLLCLPQVIRFQLGRRKGMVFYGDYLQRMPGYSDYEPYALEINMICGLADFMRDETVYPALESMALQFQVDMVVFGQTGKWGHWHLAGKDFISLGPAVEGSCISWARLENRHSGPAYTRIVDKLTTGG